MRETSIRFVLFIILILSIIELTESIQCFKECTFRGIPLNSSLPSDLCPSSKLNDNISQDCTVMLRIDFTTDLVNGYFDGGSETNTTLNWLDITTQFSLNDTSIIVIIFYTCSVSDYCDIEFVRETLSPSMGQTQMEPFRQRLVSLLYHPNNNESIQCFNNNICPQNSSFCFVKYMYSSAGYVNVKSECQNPDNFPKVKWTQSYILDRSVPYIPDATGTYYCNTRNCGLNTTAIEIFQMLAREYTLPINTSFITTTTTFMSTTMSTSQLTTSTTIPNHSSFRFGNVSMIIIIILFYIKYYFIIYS